MDDTDDFRFAVPDKDGALMPDICFHDLRHSLATISLENRDDIKTVSENLGHATVSFTLDKYGYVTEKMRKDSADRMQRYIDSVGG